MSIFDDTRSVERPQFFDGQQLFAADLDDLVDFSRAMRWLHNRSLHQPGVGNGFAVAGRRGDREVQIQPGYALDALGREIVLLDTQIEPVPAVAGEPGGGPATFDLTVSYPDDADLEEAETRDGVCEPRGVVRLRERPVLCWIRLARDVNGRLRPVSQAQALEIQNGLAIVLARAEVLECQLNADLSVAVRRVARPPQQPRLAAGTSAVAWSRWASDDGTELFGLTGQVDTASGRFGQPPRYGARIEGIRPLSLIVDVEGVAAAFDLVPYVQTPTASGFECFVPVISLFGPLDPAEVDVGSLIDQATARWRVTWFGIED
jgi:hypothetical protein